MHVRTRIQLPLNRVVREIVFFRCRAGDVKVIWRKNFLFAFSLGEDFSLRLDNYRDCPECPARRFCPKLCNPARHFGSSSTRPRTAASRCCRSFWRPLNRLMRWRRWVLSLWRCNRKIHGAPWCGIGLGRCLCVYLWPRKRLLTSMLRSMTISLYTGWLKERESNSAFILHIFMYLHFEVLE